MLKGLNAWMMSSSALMYWVPKLADIFVFVYPVFLVLLYFWWIRRTDITRKLYYKFSALFIAFSMFLAVAVNIIIQFFVDKARPNIVLGLIDEKTESILHDFLPTSSFPSDHAAISMAIAVATLLVWISKKDRRFIWLSIPLFVFSLIMSFCRITGGIHWPTDIIAWSIIGIFVPLIVVLPRYARLERFFGRIGRMV